MQKHSFAVRRCSFAVRLVVSGCAVLLLAGIAGGCGDDDGAGPDAATGPDAGPDAGPGALTVWTEHVANKVQATTAPSGDASLVLEGPRASVQAGQIVVRASGGGLSDVDLIASPLQDGAGHTLAAEQVTFYREYFIDFSGVTESEPGNEPAPTESPTGDPLVPDPLIPFVDPYTGEPAGAPFDVALERNQPVWVDVALPASAAPGTHHGTITVSARDQADVTVPVAVTVWDLTLPDMSTVRTYFASHLEQVIHYHRDTAACSGQDCWLDWTEPARTVVHRYEELAHRHRIDVGPSFIPPPEGGGDCGVPTDWAAYDAALQPYLDGSAFADGVPSAFVEAPFSPGVTWGYEGDCNATEYTALATAWADHLRGLGALDRAVAYAYDEPPESVLPDIALNSQWLQNGDAAWKAQVLVTTAPTPTRAPVLNPAVGIYCVCIRCYDQWLQDADYYGRAEWPALFNQGIQLWFYESNAQSDPYPTFATNTLLGAEPQVMMWGAWFERATGFLLWDTVAWNEDAPWSPNVDFGKTGDGVLIYPGNHDGLDAPLGSPDGVTIDGPIPSYRLKMVRAGLQDWALFQLAVDRGVEAEARAEVARVYSQFGGCDWSGCPPMLNGEYYWRAEGPLMDEVRRNVAHAVIDAP